MQWTYIKIFRTVQAEIDIHMGEFFIYLVFL